MQAHPSLTASERGALSGELLDAYDATIRLLSTVEAQSHVGRDVPDVLRLQASLLRPLTMGPRLRLVPLDREGG